MPPDAKRQRTTFRSLSTLSIESETETTEKTMVEYTTAMVDRAKLGTPFTEDELDQVIYSLQNISPTRLDWDELRLLLSNVAHLSHKDWSRTGANAQKLGDILMADGVNQDALAMWERIFTEGNWKGAVQQATPSKWAVLVTGVNGIRKTTSMYQDWFPQLLAEALVAPKGVKDKKKFDAKSLPCGDNSFFRQLDHMICSLCNEDFNKLYALTGAQMKSNEATPSKDMIQKYSNLKAAIFSRYRTLSELLGVHLLREAQEAKINAMVETSGRDVAMFHYIDEFFGSGYNKLALHFTVNDLSCAQTSVDSRMVGEMKRGLKAVESNDVHSVINANAGGPYGSEVLPGVQADSDRVWDTEVMSGKTGQDWYKATIAINAHPTKPWTAQAIHPDGTRGTVFEFSPPK